MCESFWDGGTSAAHAPPQEYTLGSTTAQIMTALRYQSIILDMCGWVHWHHIGVVAPIRMSKLGYYSQLFILMWLSHTVGLQVASSCKTWFLCWLLILMLVFFSIFSHVGSIWPPLWSSLKYPSNYRHLWYLGDVIRMVIPWQTVVLWRHLSRFNSTNEIICASWGEILLNSVAWDLTY